MKMAKLESAMRLVLAFHEAFNRQDVAAMMGVMSEDCVLESSQPPPDGARCGGKADVTQYWQHFFSGLPGVQMKIEDVFGLGAHGVARWRYEWIDAAGTKQHLRGVDVFQVRDGLISEMLSYVKG